MLDIKRGNSVQLNVCHFKGIKLENFSLLFRLFVHSKVSTVSSKLSVGSGCVREYFLITTANQMCAKQQPAA